MEYETRLAGRDGKSHLRAKDDTITLCGVNWTGRAALHYPDCIICKEEKEKRENGKAIRLCRERGSQASPRP